MPWRSLLWGRDSVGRVLGCIRLLRRLRTVEGVDFHAFSENAHYRRHARSADVEKLRSEHLGGEADVGDSRPIPMAEATGLLFLCEMLLEDLQRFQRPVREPSVARRLILMHFLLEIAANARDDQRMAVAHDDLGEPAHARPAARI